MKWFHKANQLAVLVVAFSSLNAFAAQSGSVAPSKQLEAVLAAMDNTALKFKSLEADVKVDLFSMAANEDEIQTGKTYFRKKGSETEMAAWFEKPERAVVYTDGVVRLYEPKIKQITEYEAGKNQDAVESFLNIGFGGSGHKLLSSFDVSYGGSESVDGKTTEKLVLVPKVAKVKNMFDKITLWIWTDPQSSMSFSIKQQFLEPSGDSRTSYYTNIQSPASFKENVFKLPGGMHIVHPQ